MILSQAREKEEILLNSDYEATLTIIPKPHNELAKKTYGMIFLINTGPKHNKIFTKLIQEQIKNTSYHYQVGFTTKDKEHSTCKSP